MEDLPTSNYINAIVFKMLSGCNLTAKIIYLANTIFNFILYFYRGVKHIWAQEYNFSDFLFSLQKIIYHKTCL